jgi:hypothetical protein
MKQRQMEAIDFFISGPFHSAVFPAGVMFSSSGEVTLWIVRRPNFTNHRPLDADNPVLPQISLQHLILERISNCFRQFDGPMVRPVAFTLFGVSFCSFLSCSPINLPLPSWRKVAFS